MRTVTITDRHPSRKPQKTMALEMHGGDPWCAYVWIDGTMHLITHNDATGRTAIERA